MYICIYVYVYIYICIYIHICTRTRTHLCVCVCVCVCADVLRVLRDEAVLKVQQGENERHDLRTKCEIMQKDLDTARQGCKLFVYETPYIREFSKVSFF